MSTDCHLVLFIYPPLLLAVGNKRLRVLVDANLEKYAMAESKMQKTLIVSAIVDTIKEASNGAGFVKQDDTAKQWLEVGEAASREKVRETLQE
jgi:hypothetical protein